MNAGPADVLPFRRIHIADSDEHGILRRDLGRIPEDVAELFRAETEQRCERHAVHVAGRRCVRRVDVGVRVDPENADLLVLPPVELRDTGDRSCGERVVSAEHERRTAFFKRLHNGFRGAGASVGNLLEIAGVHIAKGLRLGNLDADIAAVDDLVPQGLKPCFEPGDTHGGWAHVDAAAAGPQVQRYS